MLKISESLNKSRLKESQNSNTSPTSQSNTLGNHKRANLENCKYPIRRDKPPAETYFKPAVDRRRRHIRSWLLLVYIHLKENMHFAPSLSPKQAARKTGTKK